MKSLIKEFIETHCSKCKSYAFCAGDSIIICKDFKKFLKEKNK